MPAHLQGRFCSRWAAGCQTAGPASKTAAKLEVRLSSLRICIPSLCTCISSLCMLSMQGHTSDERGAHNTQHASASTLYSMPCLPKTLNLEQATRVFFQYLSQHCSPMLCLADQLLWSSCARMHPPPFQTAAGWACASAAGSSCVPPGHAACCGHCCRASRIHLYGHQQGGGGKEGLR